MRNEPWSWKGQRPLRGWRSAVSFQVPWAHFGWPVLFLAAGLFACGGGNSDVYRACEAPDDCEVPDLTRLYRRNGNRFPAERVREIIDGRSVVIAHGTRYMPVWGYEFWAESGADRDAEMSTRRMLERLVNYVRRLQQ